MLLTGLNSIWIETLPVGKRLLGIEDLKAPDGNSVLVRKLLHDLLKGRCSELGSLSGKEPLLDFLILFLGPLEVLLNGLAVLEKLIIFLDDLALHRNLVFHLLCRFHQRKNPKKKEENENPYADDPPEDLF